MPSASQKVASSRVASVGDLRSLARRRVPGAACDHLAGGAEGEATLRENCGAFDGATFRPRHAVALADCDLRTRSLGLALALPFLLAPVGYSRLMHPDGEVAAPFLPHVLSRPERLLGFLRDGGRRFLARSAWAAAGTARPAARCPAPAEVRTTPRRASLTLGP